MSKRIQLEMNTHTSAHQACDVEAGHILDHLATEMELLRPAIQQPYAQQVIV